MHIAIVGAGSLGLLFAAKLSSVATSIEVITRTGMQAEVLRREGISIEKEEVVPASKFTIVSYEDKESKSGEEAVESPLDFLLLTVKQTAIDDELLSWIRNRISKKTTVVCFQNGVGHEEKLLGCIHADQLLLAVTTEGAKRSGASKVAHTGRGTTDLGFSRDVLPKEQLNTQKIFAGLLEKAGFAVSLSKNMNTKVWSKLIISSVINPLTAILQIQNGQLLHSSASQELMLDLYQEGMTVAKAKHIELPDDLWEKLQLVCEKTAENQSSMLQDLLHHRSTEIESINGSLLRMAEQLKLELPVNRSIYRIVRVLENK
ncbi:ketopantoate reductase family protein [Paenibacillus eucommiae]|uniref:2-dehydropantoate 2-reductase n=1 Tax=Paenibacillus eucommiae TaxID=1355755 RepID=A0ABS4IYZ9_9BACL|nr:2-dehydropantoate 2-reductase [Paenibacillus eucommiae]MBP1992810.1 2-dehydropantoate 2-reductase [Paenibacillus eucommiae]